MARYYFNLHDGMVFPDNHGRELGTLSQARAAAADYACEMLRGLSQRCWTGEESELQVTDERGVVLFTLAFCATDIAAAA